MWMANRKFLLVSPREPSGATWLINCLLELGVKTYRQSARPMWRPTTLGFELESHEAILRKWLPALTDHAVFQFSNGIEVEWTHSWPRGAVENIPVIYFVRDPRDALFSRYKREAPEVGFEAFLRFPDAQTLLDKVDTWKLFSAYWLNHPDRDVVRFEDYKLSPEDTLGKVLAFMKLDAKRADILSAIENSTSERATSAEQKYRQEHPEDDQVINRSGRAGEWRNLASEQDAFAEISRRCVELTKALGYGDTQSSNLKPPVLGSPVASFRAGLSSFAERVKTIDFAESCLEAIDRIPGEIPRWPLVFAQFCLESHECRMLLESLCEVASNESPELVRPLVQIYGKYGDESDCYWKLYRRTGRRIFLGRAGIKAVVNHIAIRVKNWILTNRDEARFSG